MDWDKFKRSLEEQSKLKLAIGAVIAGLLFTLIFFNPRDKEFMKEVTIEIEIAKQICEQSRETILGERSRLKLGNNILNDIPIDGKIPIFRHMYYPKVMFMRNGFGTDDSIEELYCTFSDPRGANEYGSGNYYYDYKTLQWVARTKTRM